MAGTFLEQLVQFSNILRHPGAWVFCSVIQEICHFIRPEGLKDWQIMNEGWPDNEAICSHVRDCRNTIEAGENLLSVASVSLWFAIFGFFPPPIL